MFNSEEFLNNAIKDVRENIKGRAIIACSGGVDSTVATKITIEAIGDRAFPVYVDNSCTREGETAEVVKRLKETGININALDASERFYRKLKGITDPEKKRKMIGEQYIRIFEEEAEKVGADYLVQGTIAPDWIESGGGLRDVIKSHHNVGGLPDDITLKICEPLRDLYKDQIYDIVGYWNLPVGQRQPFPGPGLAIRYLGEVNKKTMELTRKANYIVETEINKAVEEGKINKPWQYFAIIIPTKSVGSQGDLRTYKKAAVIRSVNSVDAMTATFSEISYDVLRKISTRITNELSKDIGRVVYDVTDKTPGTICWE